VTNPLSAPSIGLALSGGGVRATLFTLGALLSLVDSGRNRQVVEMTSVSGGSITNAYVAQRCDFSEVGQKDFDPIARDLISAVTTGLVPRRLVLALYGVTGAIVVSLVGFSWPTPLPWLVDLLICVAYGFGLLLRGVVLAKLLGRKLFAGAGLPQSLGEQRGAVNHVFCTTDLNSTLPVYLLTRKPFLVSPVWGCAGSEDGGGLDFTTAVRASAAFPGGLPPRRVRTAGMVLQRDTSGWAERIGRLRFRDVDPEDVRALYLSDGGVWNNLGTDWYLPETRRHVTAAARLSLPSSSSVVVVDATPPPAATENLRYLRFPWLAELLSIGRVIKAMYASTIEARIAEFEKKLADPDGPAVRDMVVRLADPVDVAGHPRLCWPGTDETWSGRRWWNMRPGRLTVRRVAHLCLWNARVPTTLFRIPGEIAFQLVLQGHLTTSSSAGTPGSTHDTEDLVKRLAGLCDLAVKIHPNGLFELSRTGVFAGNEAMTRIQDVASMLCGVTTSLDELAEVTVTGIEEIRRTSKTAQHLFELSRLRRDAREAWKGRDFAGAASAYERLLAPDDNAAIDDPYTLIRYAHCLARIDDARADEFSALAERGLNGRDDDGSWLLLAEVYAIRVDGEGAVRCLREWKKFDPKAAPDRMLRHHPTFQAIADHPAVIAYLAEFPPKGT
jgi:predicted acylesterase/phospholipase RssA